MVTAPLNTRAGAPPKVRLRPESSLYVAETFAVHVEDSYVIVET